MEQRGYDAMLKSHAKEFVKQYITYDLSNRPEYVYTAYADAVNGADCQLTQYVYDGSSSRVIKRKETIGTWSSSYDI